MKIIIFKLKKLLNKFIYFTSAYLKFETKAHIDHKLNIYKPESL